MPEIVRAATEAPVTTPTVEYLRARIEREKARLQSANGEAYTEIAGTIRSLEAIVERLARREQVPQDASSPA